MWRPDSLENPYNFSAGGAIPKYELQSQAYELGADAILKGLLESPNTVFVKAHTRHDTPSM